MLHALELGVNFFDTADTYGLGRSEETLGETLAAYRDQIALATKFGVRVENGHTFFDNSPEYVAQALAASLKRLRTDHIDLYQVHYLDGHTPIPLLMETLIAHREKGDILAIGLSNITPEALPELLPYRDYIAGFQNHFSLAHRDDETAMTNAHYASSRAERIASASDKSMIVVSLMFSRLPSQRRTGRPACSSKAASSVPRKPSRSASACARFSSVTRKA